ncbi:MAG TPA: aminotransferase class III-fold pyridoxal phosphate-dependent enzyme [Geminicoccaceae bacterium]|nr:aminotransferase class III-fold pyridoxal phosphate-dependent enzyme [Geminicoccaceae bacterium]
MSTVLANATIIDTYRDRTPGSERLAREAAELFPSGITHDSRYLEPYGIYVERAEGPYKWDVDGNRYIDYFGGHGALLLGHGHPEVVAAMREQAGRGTHFGSNHPLEVRWAQAIRRLMPSAERVRFTASGTEATHMAIRLARAFTGRHRILRFRGNFHGWHDHMTSGYNSHFDGTPTPGVLAGVAENVVLADQNDREGLRRILAEHGDEIAAAILEPTGGSWGMIPIDPEFLVELRRLTTARGVLLIFDEVITGFRVSPGGAQVAYDIRPDLTTLAKIVAGGAPGGAVVGRKDVLDGLDFAASRASGREKIDHPGTFNANPVSAAAGVTALTIIAESDACERASASGAYIRRALNEMFEAERVPWSAYGVSSMFYVFLNPEGRRIRPTAFDPSALPHAELTAKPQPRLQRLRLALMINGVDIGGTGGGMISATHGRADLDETVEAFRDAVMLLRREGLLPAAG